MRPWRRIGSESVHDCRIFDLQRWRFDPGDGGVARAFYVFDAPHWINVIALTAARDVLLIRQYRFGTQDYTLEIPGGMCDPGEAPLDTARRELLEETGCEAGEIVELGWVHPNPAIQNNRCYTFLARDARRVAVPTPDANEEFEQLEVPLGEVPGLIASRRITHALVVAAFQLLRPEHLQGLADVP